MRSTVKPQYEKMTEKTKKSNKPTYLSQSESEKEKSAQEDESLKEERTLT